MLVTALATAMVWTATSIVAADVTDRPAPVVAHRDVVSELASGANGPGTPATPTTTSTSTVPPARRPAGSGGPPASVPVTTTARPAQPNATVAPPPAAVKTSPTTVPVTTSTTQPSGPNSATYSTAGGVVGVACSGFFITLQYAIPANGFAADVTARGPANVEVHFVRPGQDLSVKAVCFGRPIRYYDGFPPVGLPGS
jgi:hypothetical protein